MIMENKKTAVDWLIKEIESLITIETFQRWKVLKEQAKQKEKEKIIEHLTWFQSYLNDKGLITDYDWDFEKLAKQYIKKECK